VPCLDPSRSSDYRKTSEFGGLLGQYEQTYDKEGEFYPLELDRFNFLREEGNYVK
jgi:hypothetical protein